MNAEVSRHEDYREILDVSLNELDAPVPVMRALEAQQEQARALTELGSGYDVIRSGVASNVIACIDMDSRQRYVNEAFLQPKYRGLRMHAHNHESEHDCNGMTSCSMEKHLSQPMINILAESIGLDPLAFVHLNWVEGYTEVQTNLKGSSHADTGYRAEVRAVRALEALCNKTLDLSLVSVFNKQNESTFEERLKALAERLLLEECFAETLREPSHLQKINQWGLDVNEVKGKVFDEYYELPFMLKADMDLDEIMEILLKQEVDKLVNENILQRVPKVNLIKSALN